MPGGFFESLIKKIIILFTVLYKKPIFFAKRKFAWGHFSVTLRHWPNRSISILLMFIKYDSPTTFVEFRIHIFGGL